MNIRDAEGNVVSWDINNGELAEFNGSSDKTYNVTSQPYGFFIVPLVAGNIKVQLYGQDGDDTYLFDTIEVNASIGKRLPARVKMIYSAGTNCTRMKIVW